MELTTTNIFCIITMDKRETDGKSTSLEKACFVKELQYLLGKHVKIVEIVLFCILFQSFLHLFVASRH
jgi:hypothetical protein